MSQNLSPWLGDIVDYSMPESTISPSQGLRIWLLVSPHPLPHLLRVVSEPEFVNVDEAQESIPPSWRASATDSYGTGPTGYIGWRNWLFEAIPGLLKFKNLGTGDVQYPPEWLRVGRYDNAFGSRYIDWHSCNEGLVWANKKYIFLSTHGFFM